MYFTQTWYGIVWYAVRIYYFRFFSDLIFSHFSTLTSSLCMLDMFLVSQNMIIRSLILIDFYALDMHVWHEEHIFRIFNFNFSRFLTCCTIILVITMHTCRPDNTTCEYKILYFSDYLHFRDSDHPSLSPVVNMTYGIKNMIFSIFSFNPI